MLGYFYLYKLSASTRLRSSYFVYFQVKADVFVYVPVFRSDQAGGAWLGQQPVCAWVEAGRALPSGASRRLLHSLLLFRRSSLCPQGGASSCCGFTHCRRCLAKDSWIMPASLREDSICHIQCWKNEAMQRRRRRRRALICSPDHPVLRLV